MYLLMGRVKDMKGGATLVSRAAAGSARNLIHSVWVWLLVLLLSHPRPHIDKAS
jgi:hypothetical protein